MLALLAHQGGWDEILLVAAPMLIVAGLLALAKRRATAATATRDEPTAADDAQALTRSTPAPTSRRRPTRSS